MFEIIRKICTFNSFHVNHAGHVAELKLAEELVEDLEVLVDVLRVVWCRGKALRILISYSHSLFSFQNNFSFPHSSPN